MPRGLTPYDEASVQGRLLDVRSLKPSAWWDPAFAPSIGLPASGLTWRDRIGGNLATLTVGTMQYARTGINGCPAIYSPNYSGTLSLASPVSINVGTIAAVLLCTADNNLIALGGENSEYFGDAGSTFLMRGADDAGLTVGGASMIGAVHVAVVTVNGGAQSGYINDKTLMQGSLSSTPVAYTRIGSRAGYGQFSIGYFGDIVVFPTVLSRLQMSRVAALLLWKYRAQGALAASCPWRNRPPLIGD